ncbi:MAG: methionyl-tRNA formyltransferase [Bacteroidales bacterium]|nr:methionyl-tRNA formyltransferase [Bacteroidales bacterium]
MNKQDLRIIFMGTPDFAVASLRALVEQGYNVVAAITMPDKAKGRHQSEMQASPVKRYAEHQGIPVLQPERLKDEGFVEKLRSYQADLQIVVAFRMLPEVVWSMPRLGTFNLHGSLLPQYRGAAPINWPIINGDTETGVTTFFLTHEIDTGHIIQKASIPIADDDCAGTIHDRLMHLGASLVVDTVEKILSGCVTLIPQEQLTEGVVLRSAPKIFKDTCRIDWAVGTKRVYDFIRGLSPYPAAWTMLQQPGQKEQVVKIYRSEKIFATHSYAVGTLLTDYRSYIHIATIDGYVSLLDLQLAGKKRMDVRSLLNGFKPVEGTCVV